MEAKRRTENLVSTLNTLDAFSKWFLSVAIVIWWAAISQAPGVKIIGLKIERDKAFAVGGLFFVVMNTVFYQYLRRLKLLVYLSTGDDDTTFLDALFFHPWVLNPYGMYSVKMQDKNGLSGFNITFLIIIWWVCNMSLYVLYPFYSLQGAAALQWVVYVLVTFSFALFGVLSLSVMLSVFTLLGERVNKGNEEIKRLFSAQFRYFKPMLSASVLIGFVITIVLIFYQC